MTNTTKNNIVEILFNSKLEDIKPENNVLFISQITVCSETLNNKLYHATEVT